MKKLLGIITVLFSIGFILIAQNIPASDYKLTDEQFDTQKMKVEVIIPKNQHLADETGSVKIEYIPAYDEVWIYYTCMYVTYERGQAMNTVLECLKDFQKEKQYYSYRYLADDKERFFKDDKGRRNAQYISHVKFNR